MMKKGAVKMMETIMIIFVFFMMFMIGIIGYTRFQQSSIEAQVRESSFFRAVDVSELVTMPELRCSDYSTLNCIDYYKAKAFSSVISNDENAELYYSDKFGFSKILINIVYPKKDEIVIYSKVPKRYSTAPTFKIPINVHDVVSDTYSFAILEVKVYS